MVIGRIRDAEISENRGFRLWRINNGSCGSCPMPEPWRIYRPEKWFCCDPDRRGLEGGGITFEKPVLEPVSMNKPLDRHADLDPLAVQFYAAFGHDPDALVCAEDNKVWQAWRRAAKLTLDHPEIAALTKTERAVALHAAFKSFHKHELSQDPLDGAWCGWLRVAESAGDYLSVWHPPPRIAGTATTVTANTVSGGAANKSVGDAKFIL